MYSSFLILLISKSFYNYGFGGITHKSFFFCNWQILNNVLNLTILYLNYKILHMLCLKEHYWALSYSFCLSMININQPHYFLSLFMQMTQIHDFCTVMKTSIKCIMWSMKIWENCATGLNAISYQLNSGVFIQRSLNLTELLAKFKQVTCL